MKHLYIRSRTTMQGEDICQHSLAGSCRSGWDALSLVRMRPSSSVCGARLYSVGMRLARLGAFALLMSALWLVTIAAYRWMERIPLPESSVAPIRMRA